MKHYLILFAALLSTDALAGEAPYAPVREARTQGAVIRVQDTADRTAGTWDVDRDGEIDDAELERGFQHVGTYDTWDVDDDGMLEQDELEAGLRSTPLFTNVDLDSDRRISEEEIDLAFGDADFGEWDIDDDEALTETELYSGMYDDWNEEDDGFLARSELHQGFVNVWETDADDVLEADEFDAGWRNLTVRRVRPPVS